LEEAGGIGGLLARTDAGILIGGSSSAHSYYHADGNGNVTCLISTNQIVVAKYLYDPFGNILSKSGSLAEVNLYRFSGKECHVNSGLIYYLYRFYDPSLQRWLNRDPISEQGGIDLYRFVGNNPINEIDPYGLTWALFSGEAWRQLLSDIFIGNRPAPQPVDPNSFLAQHGVDNDFNGETGAQVVGDIGKAVLENTALAALGALGPGEAEGAYQAADKALSAAKAVKCVQAAKALPNVAKAVNSNLPHAVEQAVARGVFDSAKAAADALRALSQSITQNGFPAGTLADTAYADRVLVPVGNNGMAVYQVGANGTAKLKTVLIAH
jgi:RHS repeat-associated protein